MAQITPALLQTIEFQTDQEYDWYDAGARFDPVNHELVSDIGGLYVDTDAPPNFSGISGYEMRLFDGSVVSVNLGGGNLLGMPWIENGNAIAAVPNINLGIGSPLFSDLFYSNVGYDTFMGAGATKTIAGVPVLAAGVQHSGFFNNRPGALGGSQILCFFAMSDSPANATHTYYFLEVSNSATNMFSSASFAGTPLSTVESDICISGCAIEAGGNAYIFAGNQDNLTRVSRTGAFTNDSLSVFLKGGPTQYFYTGCNDEYFFYWSLSEQRGRQIYKDGSSYVEFVNMGTTEIDYFKKPPNQNFPSTFPYGLGTSSGSDRRLYSTKAYVPVPAPIQPNGHGGNLFNANSNQIIDLPCFHTCDIYAKKG